MIDSQAVRDYLLGLQDRITDATGAVDGQAFLTDSWEKPPTERLRGSGRTRILEGGAVMERAGVGFSHVRGDTLPPSASANRPELSGRSFEAMGVSLVFHPRNPYVPTVHMNVRCFIAVKPDAEPVWWFGGGMDLTPYYGDAEDCAHFHRTCKASLAPFGDDLYPRFKQWCDEYFFLKHRNEPRGVGGIFYDNLDSGDWEADFAFTRDVGLAFLDAYPGIVRRHMDRPWTEEQRAHQLQRRGRYVEFNLLYDRGTTFGLKTGGNTEAILMSLPPLVAWP